MFRFQILGLLRSRKPFHGYALMKEYNERTGRSYGAGYFYRQLSELHEAQFIRDAPTPPGMDRRRSLYEITDRGMEAFDSWFCKVERKSSHPPSDPLGRAIFFSEVEPTVREIVLGQWRDALKLEAKSLQDELDAIRDHAPTVAPIRPLLIHRDLLRIRADLEFLDELGRKVSSGDSTTDRSPKRSRSRARTAGSKRGNSPSATTIDSH